MIPESTTHRSEHRTEHPAEQRTDHHAGRGAMALILAVSLACGLLAPGCSFVSFGSYESFDAWYVGGKETVRAEDLGFRSLDGNLSGYVVNDILIRTPVQVALEATCIALMPVALPYYGVRSLGGAGGEPAVPEGPSEAPPEAPAGPQVASPPAVAAARGESIARS